MKKFTPFVKGIITAAAMLLYGIWLTSTKQTSNGLQFVVHALYAGGIIWTLIDYSRSPEYTGTFAGIFGQGFRCFMIVTLVMVIFTVVDSKMHPEYAEQAAIEYKKEMVKKGDKLPAEIEKDADYYKKHFTTGLVSVSIFGYLISGVFFTAIGAGFLLMRRK